MSKKTVFLVFEDYVRQRFYFSPGELGGSHKFVDVFGTLSQAKKYMLEKYQLHAGYYEPKDVRILKDEERMVEWAIYGEELRRVYIEEKELEFTEEAEE